MGLSLMMDGMSGEKVASHVPLGVIRDFVILAKARIHFDVNAENGFWITCATARPE
jgi:hypothetical protein